jgi:2'-5' RNA ligase
VAITRTLPENPRMNPTPTVDVPPARLFLALWPDARVRGRLVDWQGTWAWPASAALVPPERLHLTLHFIGNVPSRRLPDLARRLDVPMAPFDLSFGQGELWPHGLAVLRPDAVPAPLLDLHRALAKRLLALELPVDERPLRPHVTLARRAQDAQLPERGPAFRWRATGYVLVQSVPGPSGGYRRVAQLA